MGNWLIDTPRVTQNGILMILRFYQFEVSLLMCNFIWNVVSKKSGFNGNRPLNM